ncbi:uncharacterized protein LOC143239319 isoform X3 [Tachypleus tridentatus]|uniref:uncharacterized protein LOC143239319 isoform X3 n=1 Tax=Tachypleus tridentatus TaxID=6853 RepID=UPI003FD532FF
MYNTVPSCCRLKYSTGSKVPSADVKANFRKSHDDTTSLVFYKSRRMPLSSSPMFMRHQVIYLSLITSEQEHTELAGLLEYQLELCLNDIMF